jgi:hypothetical protein
LVRWDGISGTTIQNSDTILDDDENLSNVNTVTFDGVFSVSTQSATFYINWWNGQKQSVNHGTTGMTPTWDPATLAPGGTVSLSSQIGDIDILAIFFDGTNYYIVTSTDFQSV